MANLSDIVSLRDLAVNAYAEDKKYRPSGIDDGEPPGIKTTQKHKEWLNSKIYLKCTKDDILVGSCILDIREDKGVVDGLHVEPLYMNTGIGSWILNEIQRMFPKAHIWTLQTPDYSTRNHHFYKKNQFILKNKTSPEPALGFGFFKYEKKIQ
jgi:hypothetical protein